MFSGLYTVVIRVINLLKELYSIVFRSRAIHCRFRVLTCCILSGPYAAGNGLIHSGDVFIRLFTVVTRQGYALVVRVI